MWYLSCIVSILGASVVSAHGLTTTAEFYTTIASDTMTYSSIYIPVDVSKITLQLSASDVSFQPRLLIRSDALPTEHTFDGDFKIQYAPSVTYLVDREVGPLTLFLAFRGDDMLYSRRYFAGSPEYCMISLNVTLEYTDSKPLPGRFDNTPYDIEMPKSISPPSTSSSQSRVFDANLYGTKVYSTDLLMSVLILRDTYVWSTTATFNLTKAHVRAPSYVFIYAYYGSMHNQDGKVRVRFLIRPNETHDVVSVPIELSYPTSGEWFIRISMSDKGDPFATADHHYGLSLYRNATDGYENTSSLENGAHSSVVRSPTSENDGNSSLLVSFTPIRTIICPQGYTAPTSLIESNSSCSMAITSMGSIVSPTTNTKLTFYATAQGAAQDAAQDAGHVFAASLPATYLSHLTLTTQMRFRVILLIDAAGLQGDEMHAVLQDVRIDYRIGHVPAPPNTSTSSHVEYSGGTPLNYTAYSSHASRLTLSGAFVTFTGNADMYEAAYTYTLPTPTLFNLHGPGSDVMYLTLHAADADAYTIHSVYVQLDMGDCLAAGGEDGGCGKHGNCVVEEGIGRCECSYPYAGQYCDELAISQAYYALQVCILVLTNLSALPAVVFALLCTRSEQHKHSSLSYALAGVGMCISMLASMLYHACDMQAYCAFGLEFETLQVLDVLFSLLMIFMICSMYAAITQTWQIVISFIYSAVLVLCVAHDPTSAHTVILTFALIVGLILVSYVYYFLYLHSVAMGSTTHKIGGEVYIQVQDDADGDVEMSKHAQSQVQSDTSRTTDSAPLSQNQVMSMLYRSRYVACGCVCGALGLACFALQSADLYYVLHSLWHLGMMLAAFCMLKGREDWFDLLQIQRAFL